MDQQVKGRNLCEAYINESFGPGSRHRERKEDIERPIGPSDA